MPAKTKQSPKSRADWVLCPQSGLLYHSSASETHSAWLTSGSPPSPGHSHIRDNVLHCPVSIMAHSALAPTLSTRLAFSSVFLHPVTAKQCGLGQASLVRLRLGGQEVILTLFTSSEICQDSLACTPHSWLADCHSRAEAGLVALDQFTDDVEMAKDVSIAVTECEEVSESEGDKMKTSARYHLAGLVIRAQTRVPFSYLGSQITLNVAVGACDKSANNVKNVSNILNNLRLNSSDLERSMVTSTPQKSGRNEDTEVFNASTYYRISSNSNFHFLDNKPKVKDQPVKRIGGLDKEMAQLLSQVRAGLQAEDDRRLVTGVLLHGPPGTGKTLMAESLPARLGVAMVRLTGPELFSKYYGETEKRLREKFDEAKASSPCILLIDELDSLAPKRDNGGGSDQERRLIATLLTLLDSLHHEDRDKRLVVVAATSKIGNVEPALRRPGRLDMEIEVGVPNALQRQQIIREMLCDIDHTLQEENILNIARDTHGYVGADIEALVNLAALKARETQSVVTWDHFVVAKSRVKPSGMREVMVEIPHVTWADIGGLEELKLKLRQAVEWPVKHPEVFTRMGISAPRGLLMYGPPGCSKTMIAKALANESGLNFLSIKGPELFSKWVGESERAVREVFRKARQVKPSIVFFDEIDAVGGSRGGSGGGGRVGDRVLAQLLTEMDGVESLAGVTVVAATNRPDMMDPALLRPGRLDRVVYVPLPDLDTRRKVLEVHTRKIPVGDGVNLETVAERTEGYSGAEIAAVCNEAALAALEEDVNTDTVTEKHFQTALNNLKPRISQNLFEIYKKFQSEHNNKVV